MDLNKILKKFNSVKTVKDLLISIIVFVLIDAVCGLVIGFLGKIPVVGIILSLVGAVIGILCLVGIVLSIVGFIKNNTK